MCIEFRLPDIKGTDREQLRQLRSYLYQLIPQLQWALSTIRKAKNTETVLTVAQAPAWTSLGLSEGVSAGARSLGTGCRQTCKNGQVFVEFCCTVPAELPVRVSAQPIPAENRPQSTVKVLCPAEFLNGEVGVACVALTPEGYVNILWTKGSGGEAVPATVDGRLSYPTESE